jgi:RNA polymerase sigma factor (TIGR02999 family)
MGEHDVTALLRALNDGDRDAMDRLIPLLYQEIREIAAHHMGMERRDHTLQPTALVNEAYLRLAGSKTSNWESRAHFLGAASRVIRRVLVEHARSRNRLKRGGGQQLVTLPREIAGDEGIDLDLLALDRALQRLGEEDPEEKEVVELRFFGGMSVPEIARVLGVSPRTVERRWSYARAWLFRELEGVEPHGRGGDQS